jgi:phage terminase large subunit GpA-like protein
MRPTDLFVKAIVDALTPDKRIYVDQWAEQHRVLPPDTPEPGPYRTTRTPYVIDIQRTMSPGSPYREGWWMKPVQIGGSVSGENMIGAWIDSAAGSMLVVFPTLDDAKQWELTRFEPMRANTKVLRRRIRAAGVKGADNTKLRKKYPGGVMRLVGSNRVGAVKSASIRYIKFEEPDEYPRDLGGQGSTLGLAMARALNFGPRAKIFGDGTPTIKDRSEIEAQFLRGDQRRWHLNCPDCGHAQHLEWKQLKWPEGDPDAARYYCLGCGIGFTENEWKLPNYAERQASCSEADAAAAGLAHWLPTAQGEPGVASWHLNALAAPVGWRPWASLVRLWLAAQGDPEKLKIFFNNILGQSYAETMTVMVSADALRQRAERYPLMQCPAGGLLLLAGVDTQDNRLAVVVRAYGRGEQSWGVWHGEIYGDTSTPEVWGKLRDLLDAPIRHANGQMMRIDAAAIDSGGHRTEDVYAFCKDAQARGRHWFAVKGASTYDAPKLGRPKTVEFTWRGQPVPGGVTLRMVGTQAIKSLLDSRLKITRDGGGCFHFPLGFEADYYTQLRGERREWRKNKQGDKALWWVKGAERNEAWDCEVYAYVAFLYAVSGQHPETVWRQREKLFGTVQQLPLLEGGDGISVAPVQTPAQGGEGATELLDAAAAADQDDNEDTVSPELPLPRMPLATPPIKPRRPPRGRGGFVNAWKR